MADLFWRDSAACRGLDPQMFFDPDRVEDARKICATCPQRRPCGESADDNKDRVGFAAGFDLSQNDQRDRLREALGRPPRRPRPVSTTRTCSPCGEQFESLKVVHTCPSCRQMVAAEPVREYALAQRRAGRRLVDIAALADISDSALRHFLYGKAGQFAMFIPHDRARRLMAIPFPEQAGP